MDSIDDRLAWAETLIAATTFALRSRTGAATARSPSSSSWSTMAHPWSRTRCSSVRSAVVEVSVRGDRRLSSTASRYSSSSPSGSPESRTRPIEVAYAGKRVPTLMATVMIRETGTRAT